MEHMHNGHQKPADYSAPPQFAADLLARQVPVMQQQILQLQIEVAHRDHLLAEKDAELATLRAVDANLRTSDSPDSPAITLDEVFQP